MTVDRRSNRVKNLGCDLGLSRQGPNLLLVLISQFDDGFITESLKVVYLDQSLEHGEAVLSVSNLVIAVHVDTSNFDLITRPCSINQIVQNNALLLSRHSARGDRARGFLDRQLLVVPVHGLKLIKLVGTGPLASDASAGVLLCLLEGGVVSWAFQVTTHAPEEHFVELGEHTGSFGHDTTELDESVQVELSQVTKFVFDGQVTDSNEDFRVDFAVVRVDL